MSEITLGNKKEKKVLKVNIGKETYSVPLTGSLTIAEIKEFKATEDGFDFFRKYIPAEVIDSLTFDDLRALSDAWKAESAKDGQPEPGE